MKAPDLPQRKDKRMRFRYWLAAIPLLLVGTADAGVLVPGFRYMLNRSLALLLAWRPT